MTTTILNLSIILTCFPTVTKLKASRLVADLPFIHF